MSLKHFGEEIWKKPESVNEEVWTEIMTVMNKYVEISIQGDDNPNLNVKYLKRVLRKIKSWGGTGWDQLAAFWWKKITSVHYILIQIVTRFCEEGECPEWETLGRTVLISKKGKTLEKAEHFRPITTCLSVIYKIQTAIINDILRDHIFRNKIWPFEQPRNIRRDLRGKGSNTV